MSVAVSPAPSGSPLPTLFDHVATILRLTQRHLYLTAAKSLESQSGTCCRESNLRVQRTSNPCPIGLRSTLTFSPPPSAALGP
jgi:hypothetical protein